MRRTDLVTDLHENLSHARTAIALLDNAVEILLEELTGVWPVSTKLYHLTLAHNVEVQGKIRRLREETERLTGEIRKLKKRESRLMRMAR